MALDFSLLDTTLPEQIAGSFRQGYQGAQDRANLLAQRQQQRQTTDIEIKNALRAQQDIEARRAAFSATNPMEVANQLRGAGLGEEAMNLEQKSREQMARLIQEGAKSIAMAPSSYKSIFQRVKQQAAGIPLDEDERRYDEAFATGGEAAVRRLAAADAGLGMQVFGGSMYDPFENKVITPQKPSSKLIPVLVNGQPTLVPEEQAVGMTPATAQVMRRLGGGAAPSAGAARAAAPRVEPDVSAPAGKPMTELQQRKVKQEQVTELQGVKAAKSTADELEKLTDELAGNKEKGIPRHPGYSRIVGFEALSPFSLPGGPARQANNKLETFKGKISAFGRQLATQYGKLGNMAVAEWKIISDSIQNIDPAAGNLDEQMRDVVRQARDFERSMKEKYNAMYGDESQQPNAPTTPAKSSTAKEDPLGIR